MRKLLIVLLMLLTLVLVSCEKVEVVTNKISYETNNITYSDSTIKDASNALYLVLAGTVGKSFKADALKDLQSKTADIERIIRSQNIIETKYNKFFTYLNTNREDIISKINSNEYDSNTINDLINEAIKDLGLDSISNSLFDIILYFYDDKIKEYDSNSKELPSLKAHYERLRDEAKNEKETFSNIDKEMFYKLIKGFVMIDKFFQNDLSDDNSLSNDEIVLFIQKLDFDISFTESEWYVLFKNLKGFDSKLKDLASDIIDDNLSSMFGLIITDIFKLFDLYKDSINSSLIESFKKDTKEMVLINIIDSLTNEEKTLFDKIADYKLDSKYLNHLSSYVDTNEVINSTNKVTSDLYDTKTFETLYGVIRRVFYD